MNENEDEHTLLKVFSVVFLFSLNRLQLMRWASISTYIRTWRPLWMYIIHVACVHVFKCSEFKKQIIHTVHYTYKTFCMGCVIHLMCLCCPIWMLLLLLLLSHTLQIAFYVRYNASILCSMYAFAVVITNSICFRFIFDSLQHFGTSHTHTQ